MDQQSRPRFIVECTGSRAENGLLVWNGRMLDLSIPGWSPNGLKGLQAGDLLQLHLHIPGNPSPCPCGSPRSVGPMSPEWASTRF